MIDYKNYSIHQPSNNVYNLNVEDRQLLARKLPIEDIIIFLYDNSRVVKSIVKYRLKFERINKTNE